MPSISQLWVWKIFGEVIFELHPWISAPAPCNSEFPSGRNPQNSGRHLKMFRKKLTYGNASSLNFTFRPTFAVHDKSFPFFAPKTRAPFWQQQCPTFCTAVQICAFCFPSFFSTGRLSLSCPNANFSMDRISDASLHALAHQPIRPPYIRVRNIFLELTFFGGFMLARGQK